LPYENLNLTEKFRLALRPIFFSSLKDYTRMGGNCCSNPQESNPTETLRTSTKNANSNSTRQRVTNAANFNGRRPDYEEKLPELHEDSYEDESHEQLMDDLDGSTQIKGAWILRNEVLRIKNKKKGEFGVDDLDFLWKQLSNYIPLDVFNTGLKNIQEILATNIKDECTEDAFVKFLDSQRNLVLL
jgi:predicted house-cleaning noncanonical NTP pyrophosphatase (MazG superfamily)